MKANHAVVVSTLTSFELPYCSSLRMFKVLLGTEKKTTNVTMNSLHNRGFRKLFNLVLFVAVVKIALYRLIIVIIVIIIVFII